MPRTMKSRAPTKLPPSRAGKKPVTAYVELDTHKELRMLGIKLGKSSQQMLTEALHSYLRHHAE